MSGPFDSSTDLNSQEHQRLKGIFEHANSPAELNKEYIQMVDKHLQSVRSEIAKQASEWHFNASVDKWMPGLKSSLEGAKQYLKEQKVNLQYSGTRGGVEVIQYLITQCLGTINTGKDRFSDMEKRLLSGYIKTMYGAHDGYYGLNTLSALGFVVKHLKSVGSDATWKIDNSFQFDGTITVDVVNKMLAYCKDGKKIDVVEDPKAESLTLKDAAVKEQGQTVDLGHVKNIKDGATVKFEINGQSFVFQKVEGVDQFLCNGASSCEVNLNGGKAELYIEKGVIKYSHLTAVPTDKVDTFDFSVKLPGGKTDSRKLSIGEKAQVEVETKTPKIEVSNPTVSETDANSKGVVIGKIENITGNLSVMLDNKDFVANYVNGEVIVKPINGKTFEKDKVYDFTFNILQDGKTRVNIDGTDKWTSKVTVKEDSKEPVKDPTDQPEVVKKTEKELKDQKLKELEDAARRLIDGSLNSLSQKTMKKEFRLERKERKNLDKGIKSLATITQGDPKAYKDALDIMLQAAKDKKIVESWSVVDNKPVPNYSPKPIDQREADLLSKYIGEVKTKFDEDFDKAYKKIMGQEVYEIDVSEEQYKENPEVAKALEAYKIAKKKYSDTYKSKQNLEEKIFELMGRKNTLIADIKGLQGTKDTEELKKREAYKNELRTIYIKLEGKDVIGKSLEGLDTQNDKIDEKTVETVLKREGLDRSYKLQLDNADESALGLKQQLEKTLWDKNEAFKTYESLVGEDDSKKMEFVKQQSTDNVAQVDKNIQEATTKKGALETEKTTVETNKKTKTEEIESKSKDGSYYQKEDVLQKDLDERNSLAKRQAVLEQEIRDIYIRNKVAEQKRIYGEQKVHENADNINNQELDRVNQEIRSIDEEISSMNSILQKRKEQIRLYTASASETDQIFLDNVSKEIQKLVSDTIPALKKKKEELEIKKNKLTQKKQEITTYADFSKDGLTYLERKKNLFPLQDMYDNNMKRLGELQPQIDQLSTQKTEKDKVLSETKTKLETAQKALDAAIDKGDASAIGAARTEVSSLGSQKRTLESELSVISMRLDVANKEKVSIESWNATNKPKIDAIKAEISKVDSRLETGNQKKNSAKEYKSGQSTDPREENSDTSSTTPSQQPNTSNANNNPSMPTSPEKVESKSTEYTIFVSDLSKFDTLPETLTQEQINKGQQDKEGFLTVMTSTRLDSIPPKEKKAAAQKLLDLIKSEPVKYAIQISFLEEFIKNN